MTVNVHRDLINEQVYEYIKDKIIYNEFKPNEKIDVTQLVQTHLPSCRLRENRIQSSGCAI